MMMTMMNEGVRLINHKFQQKAQTSQRDSVTLRVIEHFAKSLKVIRNDTVE